jgi:hypothetical protein
VLNAAQANIVSGFNNYGHVRVLFNGVVLDATQLCGAIYEPSARDYGDVAE